MKHTPNFWLGFLLLVPLMFLKSLAEFVASAGAESDDALGDAIEQLKKWMGR